VCKIQIGHQTSFFFQGSPIKKLLDNIVRKWQRDSCQIIFIRLIGCDVYVVMVSKKESKLSKEIFVSIFRPFGFAICEINGLESNQSYSLSKIVKYCLEFREKAVNCLPFFTVLRMLFL
jgi:hypothetical protein